MSIYPSMRVSYISLLDSRDNLDVLRVTESWRGKGPRRDYILFNDSLGLSVAQVLCVFRIQFRQIWYPIAYIRPLQVLGRSKVTGYIELRDHSTRNFIFASSIIRSCVVLSPGARANIHILYDLEGPDMYLRLSEQK